MHIHILGICGTFMGGIAQIASALGHQVSGSDLNIYPPMSEHLANTGIDIKHGYLIDHLMPAPDLVLIGNAMSRGNEAVEYVLREKIPYDSGPAWLRREVLQKRTVIAVAGTHGKTTTTSLIAWILAFNGKKPGYLIGGLANNFEFTAALGEGDVFVIEADEYDTAFFDKRSKFVHYQPNIFILNNLEFDHADIFDDIEDIQRQIHHAVRTVPNNGCIFANVTSEHITTALNMGCWSPVVTFGFESAADWQLVRKEKSAENAQNTSGNHYLLNTPNNTQFSFSAPIAGDHNALNAAVAVAATNQLGVSPADALKALESFSGVKRRLENYATVGGIALYDDFAHHPTAIAATLTALQNLKGDGKIHCVIEPRSNTMKNGTHEQALESAFDGADSIIIYEQADLAWDIKKTAAKIGEHCKVLDNIEKITEHLAQSAHPGDHIVVMSNGGFQGIHEKLRAALENR